MDSAESCTAMFFLCVYLALIKGYLKPCHLIGCLVEFKDFLDILNECKTLEDCTIPLTMLRTVGRVIVFSGLDGKVYYM